MKIDENIYFKTLKLFGEKGSRFTTEDLARELGTSKRTIYTIFSNKEDLLEKTIDFVFKDVLESDKKILENNELNIQEKIRLYLGNIPVAYNVDTIIRHMSDLYKYYPNLYKKVNIYIYNTKWDDFIELIEKGIKNKELEEVNLTVLRLILNETLKKLLDYEFILKNQVSFESGIKAMNDIILYGLIKRDK